MKSLNRLILKMSFLISTFLSSGAVISAPALHCSIDDYAQDLINDVYTSIVHDGTTASTGTLGVIDEMVLDCHTKDDAHEYKVKMAGPGLGLWLEQDPILESIVISCPLVRKKKLVGNYYGVKLSAGFMVGANLAVFSNARLGLCFIAGFSEAAFGASVGLDQLKIIETTPKTNTESQPVEVE